MATMPKYDDSAIKQMSFREHVRSKSSMYIGPGTVEANTNQVFEGVKNYEDEQIDPMKIYESKIIIFTEGNKYQVAILDHGRGVPCGKVKLVMTSAYTSGKYEKKAYNGVSSGTYGLGLTLLSILSNVSALYSKRLDGFAGVNLYRGELTSEYLGQPLDQDASSVGTTLFFEPDDTILKETDTFLTDPRGLQTLMKYVEFSSTFRPNGKTTIYKVEGLVKPAWFKKTSLIDQWKFFQSVKGEVLYRSPNVVDAFLYSKKECGIEDDTVWSFTAVKPITASDDDIVGFDIHLGMCKKLTRNQGIVGLVNYNRMNSPKDSHVAALQDQFKAKLIQYVDEDDTELRAFFMNSYHIPFHGYIAAVGKNLSYVDQVKTGFVSSQWARVYGSVLKQYLDKEPDALFEQLFDLIEQDLMTKFTREMNGNISAGKSLKNVAFELKRSDSYFACETRDKTLATLNIVEGLSSGNWIVQLRDPSFQAVYELRGKCLNTFTSSKEQWYKDEVFSDLIRLIGVHPRDTNLDNMNFSEICIMADADPDGLSIINLLIGMLYNINPLLLEEGRVKIAMPPLYILASKDRRMFLRDQHALDDAMVVIYETHMEIGVSVNGGKINYMHGEEFRDVVYLVKHICNIIQDVSRKLAIDPFIVEQMCHCVDYINEQHVNVEAIKVTLGLTDCMYNQASKVLTLIQGKSEMSVPLDRLRNEIRNYILPVLRDINWQSLTFFVTTKNSTYYKDAPVMLWQMQQIFDVFNKEFSIERIKGLGECGPQVLKYTCIDPATRTVVTIKGVGDVKTLFDMLGVDTAERKKLLTANFTNEWVRGEL